MLTVYVAGPLSSGFFGREPSNGGSVTDYIKNCHRMIAEANRLRVQGFAPFVPCLDYLLGLVDGNLHYADYYAPSQEWLKRSDAVYVIARSPGVDKELALAQRLGIPWFMKWKDLIAWQARCRAAQKAIPTQDKPPTHHGHPRFYELLDGLRELHNRKNHDYAGADDPLRNFRKCEAWGLKDFKGCFVRMGDKYSRIEEFLKQGVLQVKDETVIDTARDLAVYALLFIILFEESQSPAGQKGE